MKLRVFARFDLVDATSRTPDPSILLEGSWPSRSSGPARWSLDDAVNARFEWIDEAAAYWAEHMDQPRRSPGRGDDGLDTPDAVWLNALALRYYLVKLIRVVAYFTEVRVLSYGDVVKFVGVRGRDEDYADLLRQLCRLVQAEFRPRWIDRPVAPAGVFPPNSPWRRGLAHLGRLVDPHRSASSARRVVLCGNRNLLDPVCRELLARGCGVWWLYDRFAVRTWLRWRPAGGGQLVCNSSLARGNRFAPSDLTAVDCRGVNLAGPLSRWLRRRLETLGPRQCRIVEQIDVHFRQVVPHVLVLDEDATPFARAAVAMARRYGARSFVVQHGAPCCRFGFTPPAADRVLVWGASSQWQLARWSVDPGQVRVTGSPRHDEMVRTLMPPANSPGRSLVAGSKGPPRILLLATVPPRDDRPDAVALHLTRSSYRTMLRMALAAVAQIPDAQLALKPHPRTVRDPVAEAAVAEFPAMATRLVRGQPLESLLGRFDCVLSCASSAAVEATLAGLPVIQLAPPGSAGVLPHQQWGMFGTARNEGELQQLLAKALSAEHRPVVSPDPNVFGNLDTPAAAQIARAVLEPGEPWFQSKIVATVPRHPPPEMIAAERPPAARC